MDGGHWNPIYINDSLGAALHVEHKMIIYNVLIEPCIPEEMAYQCDECCWY